MTYFAGTVENIYWGAIAKVEEEINMTKATASAQGYLLGGRLWIEIEKVFIDNVSGYSHILFQKLTSYDNEHSPIKPHDFKLAQESVKEFELECQNIYKKLREKKAFKRPSIQPFADDSMARALKAAIDELEGARWEFESKRSFWKWAVGDAKKRIFSFIMAGIGSALTALIYWIFR